MIDEIMIDQEMQVEVCSCMKCEKCRQLEIELVESGCECVYEDIIKADEEGNEYTERVLITKCDHCKTIESINLRYDNYRLMEKANINKEFWDIYKVVDGVIYTTNECNNNVDMQTLVTRIVESTL